MFYFVLLKPLPLLLTSWQDLLRNICFTDHVHLDNQCQQHKSTQTPTPKSCFFQLPFLSATASLSYRSSELSIASTVSSLCCLFFEGCIGLLSSFPLFLFGERLSPQFPFLMEGKTIVHHLWPVFESMLFRAFVAELLCFCMSGCRCRLAREFRNCSDQCRVNALDADEIGYHYQRAGTAQNAFSFCSMR